MVREKPVARLRRGIARVDLGARFEAFQVKAAGQGLTVSAVLRGLVGRWLEGADVNFQHAGNGGSVAGDARAAAAISSMLETAEPAGGLGSRATRRAAVRSPPVAVAVPGRVDGATRRVEIALTESEYDLAKSIAAADGFTLNRWLAAMVRARLTGQAVLGEPELAAIGAASAELGAVGRNLNQIARTLNTDGVGPDRYPERGLLISLAEKVDAQVREVRRVLEDNRQRWSLRGR
ncbi:MAG: hypothetical protein AB7P21_30200 [Lautropia sp.]